jgi:hypothetical protein
MIPARETLRVAYDAVIEQINSSRGSEQLTNAFYSKIGDAIFEACYGALENSEAAKAGLKTPKALQVVSAPMGAGKTTFTLAFITALGCPNDPPGELWPHYRDHGGRSRP